MYYRLEHSVHPCSLMEWALHMEQSGRVVASTDLDEEVWVSTVFLGLDHSHGFGKKPILFETMVFGEEKISKGLRGKPFVYREDLGQWRYSTWGEALRGHESICATVKRELDEARERAAQGLSATIPLEKWDRRERTRMSSDLYTACLERFGAIHAMAKDAGQDEIARLAYEAIEYMAARTTDGSAKEKVYG